MLGPALPRTNGVLVPGFSEFSFTWKAGMVAPVWCSYEMEKAGWRGLVGLQADVTVPPASVIVSPLVDAGDCLSFSSFS